MLITIIIIIIKRWVTWLQLTTFHFRVVCETIVFFLLELILRAINNYRHQEKQNKFRRNTQQKLNSH